MPPATRRLTTAAVPSAAITRPEAVFQAIGGSQSARGHAVYPGTFDPVTPGHLGVIERARLLFAQVTVVVAVNGDKQPAGTGSERAVRLRGELPADWENVSVAAWAGLTVAFCRQHGADVIIRGVRNRSDFRHEYQLAVMNQGMGITTLLLPAGPGLAGVSSTVLRGLGTAQRARLPSHDASEAGAARRRGDELDAGAGPHLLAEHAGDRVG
jgi:pantetheine-phosphate adenylyltransferase